MNDSKISVRYSKALFQSALEKNILDKVNQDMVFISEICKNPEAKELLQSPIIIPQRRRSYFMLCLKGMLKRSPCRLLTW